MKVSEEFKNRIDEVRLNDAFKAADFLAENFLKDGRFNVKESWGPEGVLYLAESSWALMDAYRISRNVHYMEAVQSILNELRRLQKKSGGWAIELGKNGVGFKVTEEERNDSIEKEDPPTSAAMLRTISEYYTLSGDNSYYDLGEKAFNYLMKMWDPKQGTFVDNQARKLLNLRSNPSSYHLFFLIGISAWKDYAPETVNRICPILLEFVKKTFESFDENTMPLIYALHAATLMDFCSDNYIHSIIKPRIDKHLINNENFRCNDLPGGYGHRDGLRGIVKSEAHMRSSAGIAIASKKYDLISGTRIYRDTQKYIMIADWIDQMKGDGFYYEFEMLPERIKKGYGSPGQYLPIWWILGQM